MYTDEIQQPAKQAGSTMTQLSAEEGCESAHEDQETLQGCDQH